MGTDKFTLLWVSERHTLDRTLIADLERRLGRAVEVDSRRIRPDDISALISASRAGDALGLVAPLPVYAELARQRVRVFKPLLRDVQPRFVEVVGFRDVKVIAQSQRGVFGVLWLSEYPYHPRQLNALQRLYGEGVVVREMQDTRSDYLVLVQYILNSGFRVVAPVLPMAVLDLVFNHPEIQARIAQGTLTFLWSDMRPAHRPDQDSVSGPNGTHFHFVQFLEVHDLGLDVQEIFR